MGSMQDGVDNNEKCVESRFRVVSLVILVGIFGATIDGFLIESVIGRMQNDLTEQGLGTYTAMGIQ